MGCIVGKTIGKTKIKDKTLEGTIAEFVTASLVAYPFIGFFGLIGAALIAIFDVLDKYKIDINGIIKNLL